MTLDALKLIREVEKHPAIWNSNLTEIRHRLSRLEGWSEVARAFYSNYDELPSSKKTEICDNIQKKWRHLRDNYVRSLRKAETNPKTQPYTYGRAMSFLRQVYKNRKKPRKGSLDRDTQPDEDTEKSASSEEEVEMVEPANVKQEEEQEASVFLEYPSAEEYPMSSSYNFDEDKMFFESLLPAVREFNLDQKLEFRTQVLELVKKIRRNSF